MNIIVGCVIIDDDKVLMVREAEGQFKDRLGFPVGHLEEDESIIDGALREVYEESGYKVKLKGLLPISETNNEHGKYVVIRFLAEPLEKHNIDLDQISDVVWMKIDEVLKLDDDMLRYVENKKVLKHILNKEMYPLSMAEEFRKEVESCE